MKSLSKLVRRYMLAAAGIVLLVLLANMAAFVGMAIHAYRKQFKAEVTTYFVREVAESFVREPDGTLHTGPQHAEEEWLAGWEWGMLLSDEGEVLWQYQLPPELEKRYTVREVASFSRWYLADYPVMTYLNDYGTLVLAKPKGSVNRYNFYMSASMQNVLIEGFAPLMLLDLLLVLIPCALFGWSMHRRFASVEQGLDALAKGRPVHVPEKGTTADLARRLNATGEHLRRQSELIDRRDAARTSWIAGVSHDIRTPLALILAYAEQLESTPGMDDAGRRAAGAIRAQSIKIKTLIEDLNLTSKLQYKAQPLRLARCNAGRLLREAAAGFCNGAAGARCPVELELSRDAQNTALQCDAALLGRALDNLLGNSARHNPAGCAVRLLAQREAGEKGPLLRVTVEDDGAGYPPGVLAAMADGPSGGKRASAPAESDAAPPADAQPHILGLHVVEQVAAAHGGSVRFENLPTGGARATLLLPAVE